MSAFPTIEWRHGPILPADHATVLPALFAEARRRCGQAILIREADRQADWPWLEMAAARIARAWSTLVPAGARVAVVLPNGIDHQVAEHAIWRLGAIAAPLTPGPGVTAAAVADLRPVLVVTDDVALAPPGCPCCTTDELHRLAERGPGFDQRPVAPDDACLLLSTSGSGGRARGVLLTHRNICTQQAAYALLWPDFGVGDRLAGYLPWHHSFGGLAERMWTLVRGACLTVVPGGGRDHAAFLDALRAVRPTVFQSVPKMHRLATQAGVLDLAALRWVFTAGAPLGAPEECWYAERGVRVQEGWGLTETSPSATITPPWEPRTPGCVGRPIAGVAVGVRADGRILIAGPGVMAGYDGDDAANGRVFGHDPAVGRWFDSGDLGMWSQAGLHLAGRADHTIKLANGEKVALGAIAEHLEAGAGIRAAVVCCRDDAIEAIVALQPGHGDEAVLAAAAAADRAADLPCRRIRAVWRLVPEPSVENGLLTPSMKVCRGRWLEALGTTETVRLR